MLPPYNTLRAEVIRRGRSPEIIEGDISVTYMFGENTRSADKVNFWEYAPALVGVTVPPNTGLTGSRTRGTMARTTNKDWAVTGIPITPIRDDGREDAYPLATITAQQGATVPARTQAVVPVSWEISCNLCHGGPAESFGDSVLRLHDRLHQTTLAAQRPVNCSTCHADPVLGSPLRTPWGDVPKCGGCHTRNGLEFEEPGSSSRSRGGTAGWPAWPATAARTRWARRSRTSTTTRRWWSGT